MEALIFIFAIVVLYVTLSLFIETVKKTQRSLVAVRFTEIVYRFDCFKSLQDLFNRFSKGAI